MPIRQAIPLAIGLAIGLGGLVGLNPLAAAQTPTPTPPPPAVYTPTSLTPAPGLPRTPDGQPDLQGVVWATNFFPVFEANPLSASLTVSEAEAKKIVEMMVGGFMKSDNPSVKIDPEIQMIIGETDGFPLVRGERRTRQVVLPADGKLPYTPEARKEARTSDPLGGKGFAHPEERPSAERCLSLGGLPPISSTLTYNRMQIIQTPTHVVLHVEQGDDARIIPFSNTHKANGTPAWLGDSIARWDSDTLVIETIGLRQEDRVRTVPAFIVGASSKVIERYTRVSKDELLYQYTVVDPATYTAPWLAEYSLYAADTGMFPSQCHEHNLSLPNILRGGRVADAKLGQAKR